MLFTYRLRPIPIASVATSTLQAFAGLLNIAAWASFVPGTSIKPSHNNLNSVLLCYCNKTTSMHASASLELLLISGLYSSFERPHTGLTLAANCHILLHHYKGEEIMQ